MSEFNEPPKSGWATIHRVCGWFLFALGGFAGVLFLNASVDSERGAAIQLLILGIAGGITFFLFAFLIDVFTDMRHYLQSGNSILAKMNAKLTDLATGQLKIEAEAEAMAAAKLKIGAEAEAMAAAKPATEKRLEWAGKAMQRAGFKEETLKRALTQGGTVVAWGDNSSGRTSVPAGLSGVVAIVAAWGHTVALKQDGTVVAWGDNGVGQTTLPARLSGVVAIAAGEYHTVALKQDGTVVAWGGSNSSGQSTVPAGLSGVVAIAAGTAHTVALKQDGTVVAWGYNDNGQTRVPAGLSGVVAVAAGALHTVALKQD